MIWLCIPLAVIAFVLFWPITYTIDAKPWKLRAKVSAWGGILGKSIALPPDKKEPDETGEDISYPSHGGDDIKKDKTRETPKAAPKNTDDPPAEERRAEEMKEPLHDDSLVKPEKPVISYTLSSQGKDFMEEKEKPSAKEPDFPESHDTIEETAEDDDEPGVWDLVRLAIHNGALELALHNLGRLVRHGAPRWVIEGDFGTGDPAETGITEGIVQAALPASSVRVRYHYTDKICSIRVHAKGRVFPCVLAWIVLRVLLSRPVRELWHARQGRHVA